MKIQLKTLLLGLSLCASMSTAFAQSKANKQYELKAFHLAVKSYIRYINQNPSDGVAMANLADCYRHLNQMQEAMEWYERAMSTPKDIEAEHFLYYGKVLMAIGSYDRALDQFRQYAQINEEVGRHYMDKANYAKTQRGNRSPYKVMNEAGMNTSAAEFGPAFYQVDQLVFSSGRTDAVKPSDLRNGVSNWLFLATQQSNGALEPVVLINKAVKKKSSEGPVSYSADGSMVAITRNNFVDGKRHLPSGGMKLDLYLAKVDAEGGWSNAEPFPYNDSEYSTGFAHLAADGNTLYFASDRPDANHLGGLDIYVSYKTKDTWSTPENLGPAINTPGDEITPYFDGRNLYFASNWHPGLGGYDVFRSEKSGGRWSRITHLGVGVNSPRDDYGFIYDGIMNKGFFVSNREQGNGLEDIYSITQAFEEIALQVINASDEQPIADVTIDFVECGLETYQTDEKGMYIFPLQNNMNCRILIRKEGYLTSSIQLSDAELREKKRYQVVLQREGEEYAGSIIDGVSRIPISDVYVRATNQVTGKFVETVADEDGEYALSLSPNAMYIIRYSKAGYTDMNRTLPTADGTDRTILGTFPMQRVGEIAPIPPVEDLAVRDSLSGDDMATAPVARPDAPYQDGVVISTEPAVTPPIATTATTSTPTYTGTVYSVQIAATKQLQLAEYERLKGTFDNIYYVKSFDLHKVRVGPYIDKLEAARAMRQLEYRGFEGAFIVLEEGENLGDSAVIHPNAIGGAALASADNFTTKSVKTNNDVIKGGYKIRLGSYTKPKQSFRDTKVKQYGVVEKRIQGKWTIMLLGGFATAKDAKGVLNRVRSAGFKDAFVIEELSDGELRKVQ
ncbi:MAG: SPOR domain-containing protein [Bacteroidota bacterium]